MVWSVVARNCLGVSPRELLSRVMCPILNSKVEQNAFFSHHRPLNRGDSEIGVKAICEEGYRQAKDARPRTNG